MQTLMLASLTLAFAMCAQTGECTELPFLKAYKTKVVTEDDRPIPLRGCNLGNWLVMEMWMLHAHPEGVCSQVEFEKVLEDRFGSDGRDLLMHTYRENWITERDFKIIKSFGMNLVRLPFQYSSLEDDANPMHIKPGGWKWLDRAVDWAEKHGLYIILDLHGAVGRQSGMDHTGECGVNRLFSDPAAQERTVWLWKEIAKRYKNRSCVAGYDPLNEPWGGSREDLRALVDRIYWAIREVDMKHIIFLPGFYDGIDFYDAPARMNYANVVFEMHFYPGFFGWGKADVGVHKDFLMHGLPGWVEKMKQFDAPLFVGEFNVVLNKAGGAEMMRRYFDFYSAQGWPATMWSYKVASGQGGHGAGSWGMVVNRNPLPPFDLYKDSRNKLLAAFRSYGSMEYEENRALKTWLTTEEKPTPVDRMVTIDGPFSSAPDKDEAPKDWAVTDIGNAREGGLKVWSESSFDLYGGGDDIWGTRDQFRFMYQEVPADGWIEAQVTALSDAHPQAKAGLMIRSGLDADAAHVMINLFPDGGIEVACRKTPGGKTLTQRKGYASSLKPYFGLRREGEVVRLAYRESHGPWIDAASIRLEGPWEKPLMGLAVLSHDNKELVKASFRQIRQGRPLR